MKFAMMMATVAACSAVAFAAPAQQERTAPASQTTTISGCIVKEADFRAMHNEGKGGVVGTGIGVGNEFILTHASRAAAGAVGTSGTGSTASSPSYELTGPGEGQAAAFVGKRVEVTGHFKAEEVKGAAATGGPTAGKPPSGVDVTSKDMKLREFEVASVKAGTGSCDMK